MSGGLPPPSCGATKADLRRAARAACRALAPALRASEEEAVAAALAPVPSVGLVAGYAALPWECNLDGFLWRSAAVHGAVLLPRCLPGGALAWHRVGGPEGLITGAHGIREPDPVRCPPADLATAGLLLVPGTGFGPAGQRLGQGAGYYDRVLAQAPPGLLTVGVGFSCQLMADLPEEAHDRRVQAVLLGGTWILPPPGRP